MAFNSTSHEDFSFFSNTSSIPASSPTIWQPAPTSSPTIPLSMLHPELFPQSPPRCSPTIPLSMLHPELFPQSPPRCSPTYSDTYSRKVAWNTSGEKETGVGGGVEGYNTGEELCGSQGGSGACGACYMCGEAEHFARKCSLSGDCGRSGHHSGGNRV